MDHKTRRTGSLASWASGLWATLREQFGTVGQRRSEPVNDRAGLRRFLETRSNYVAQMSLYGYLRTRAGKLYPEYFQNDDFVRSVNSAKWLVWLACLSDLSVYAGGLLIQRSHGGAREVGALIEGLVGAILDDAGVPADADAEFLSQAQRVRARLAACDWTAVTDDDTPFSASPTALVRWAPVLESMKQFDEAIVRNSVRFRWQEIRRDLRRNLNADAVLHSAA
jgi:hypothetical protein